MDRAGATVFDRLWHAYGQGRIEEVLHLIHPACDIVLTSGRRYRGPAGMLEWLDHERRCWKSLTVTYDEVRVLRDDRVVATGRVTGSSADGEHAIDATVSWVLDVLDGRLVGATAFADAALALSHGADDDA